MTPEQFREADNAIRGALRNAKKYQDFEDIYQDSWVYLLRRLDKFDDSQGRLGTWAYTTAKWIYSTRYKYMAR